MDIGKIKIDSARIEGGVTIGDIPGMGDLRLTVRGFTSPTYRAALQAAQRGVARGELNRDGSTPPALADKIMAEAMGRGILLGWEGLEEAGAPVPFSPEKAIALLGDPDLRAFRDAVSFAATEADAIKKDDEALVLGNSRTSSTGISGTEPNPAAS